MMATTLPTMTLKTPLGFVYDKRKEKWELLDEGCQVEGEPVLEVVSFLLEGEEGVKGQVMRSRSLEMGGRTGQHHAERMLTQAMDIPAQYRQFLLVFPDTLWQDPCRCRCVPCLEWCEGRWVLQFHILGGRRLWRGRYRIVRVCVQSRS